MRRTDGRFRLGVALGVVALAAAGLAASASAIVGGSPDGTDHPYVGLAEYTYTGSDGHTHYELCSGSLVSLTVMVTAGHCFPNGSKVQVSFDSGGTSLQSKFALTRPVYEGTFYTMPGFAIGGPSLPGFDHNDVAVIVLDSSSAVTPAASLLPTAGYVDTLKGKQTVTLVGYGVSDFAVAPGVGPYPVPVLYRQVAPANLIPSKDVISGEFLKLSSDTAQGKGGACYGDSGGPVLLNGQMVAIDSFGANPICNGNQYAERIDTADALAFIDAAIGGRILTSVDQLP